jgi:thiosulfate/3-mercaptopyruvate sulfurtransferase
MKKAELISSDWIAEHMNDPDIRIVEVGDLKDPQAYASGHIPGAIHWPWQESLWHPTMREFVTPHDFAQLMQKSGIGHHMTVVFYSNLIQFSTYAFWVCTLRGHTKIKILDGNRSVWQKDDRALSPEVPKIKPVEYPVQATDESYRIGREGVLAGLDNPDRVLLDLRTPEEYLGQRVSPKWFTVDHGAQRKGHIPGAKHLFYADLLNADESFKPLDKLRSYFVQIGATPDKEIVLYCRLSHRATMGWFVAKYLLGYTRVKVYDGSWTEWGSSVGLPIINRSIERKS